MHAKATFVFWTTLILYIITLCTVSYVGVYLTYIALPLIVLSGLIMKCSKPKPEHKEMIDNSKTALKEMGKVTSAALDGFNSFLDECNTSLGEFNEITKLGTERTAHLREKKHQLDLLRIPFNAKYDVLKDPETVRNNRERRNQMDSDIRKIEKSIETIKMACELEVKSRKLKVYE